jgi:hypothetical protein
MVKPQNMLLVCTGSGAMQLQVQSDDGSTGEPLHTGMDCPLCAATGAPPPASQTAVPSARPMACVLQGTVETHMAVRSAPPLSARGPPVI